MHQRRSWSVLNSENIEGSIGAFLHGIPHNGGGRVTKFVKVLFFLLVLVIKDSLPFSSTYLTAKNE